MFKGAVRYLILVLWIFVSVVLWADADVYTYSNTKTTPDLRQLSAQSESTAHYKRTSYVLPIHRRDPSMVRDVLMGLFPNSRISVDSESRTIVFSATPSEFREFRAIIQKLDRKLPQLLIQVKILEVNRYHLENYNTLFSDISTGFKLNVDLETQTIRPSEGLSLSLEQLLQEGSARLLAKPQLVTMDNHRSVIRVGDQIPYMNTRISDRNTVSEVQYLDSGIELDILPRLTKDGHIRCDVNAKISSVKLWKSFAGAEYPVLSTRETHTVVTIESGKTLVLAGLYDTVSKRNNDGNPFLSNIPIIGDLFVKEGQEESQSDIVFMIRPLLKEGNKKALE